jgi:protein SCO1/2
MPLSVFRAIASLLVVALVATSGVARAQSFTDTGGIQPSPAGMPPQLEHVGVKEHLDQPLPLDAEFRDHTGNPVRLQAFFDGKRPVVLVFAYHSCQVVCSMVMGAVLRSLQGIKWSVGNEFDVVVISIDPNDTFERTTAKRNGVIHDYGRGDGKGFHYLVGTKTNIDRVANAAGFAYEYDASQNIYGHPSLMMLVKPNGQMARYLYGLEFDPNDVRLGLLEASEGRSISTVEQMILYCYHYDPQGGKYVLVATRVMQVAGSITALLLGGVLLLYWLRERRKGGLLAKLSPEHQRKGGGPTEAAPNPT